MARVNLSFYKVLELPVDPQPDAIYYVFDEDNNVANWYVTTSEGVAIPASDPAAVAAMIASAIAAADTLPVVQTASATVNLTAADSGKIYRFTHSSPTVNLPTTGLVAGKTHFRLTFVSSGAVDAGDGKDIDFLLNDSGSFSPIQNQTASNLMANTLFEVRYIGSNLWVSNLVTLT